MGATSSVVGKLEIPALMVNMPRALGPRDTADEIVGRTIAKEPKEFVREEPLGK